MLRSLFSQAIILLDSADTVALREFVGLESTHLLSYDKTYASLARTEIDQLCLL